MAAEEVDDLVEDAVLRLEEIFPEGADHRRRQHHRQQDRRAPETVGAELAIEQQREREAEQQLQRDRADQEVRRRAHVVPDRFVAQNALVVGDAGPQDVGVRLVSAVVGERQVDRPQQRKDVEGQQQDDRRRDEQPRERSIRQSLMASEYGVHG